MRSRLAQAVLAFIALSASVALAGRPPQAWVPPEELTPEQIEAQKIASKQKFNPYAKDVPAQSAPIPWMAIGMAGLAFVVAAPFALRAYRNTSEELAPNGAYAAARDLDDPADRG